MTLAEAQSLFLGKRCKISWENQNGRDGALVPIPTFCVVTEIYENCYKEVLFLSDKTFTPFSVKRLSLAVV